MPAYIPETKTADDDDDSLTKLLHLPLKPLSERLKKDALDIKDTVSDSKFNSYFFSPLENSPRKKELCFGVGCFRWLRRAGWHWEIACATLLCILELWELLSCCSKPIELQEIGVILIFLHILLRPARLLFEALGMLFFVSVSILGEIQK